MGKGCFARKSEKDECEVRLTARGEEMMVERTLEKERLLVARGVGSRGWKRLEQASRSSPL